MGLFGFKKKKADSFSDSSLSSDNPFGSPSQQSSQQSSQGVGNDSSRSDFSGFSSQGMYGDSSNPSNPPGGNHESYNPPDPFSSNMNPSSSYSPIDRDGGAQNQNHGQTQPGHHSMSSKNMEIVLSKLDAIRLAIQNIDHRLAVIENHFEHQKADSPNLRNPDEENLF